MLKASENPPMRPPDCRSVRHMAGQWWVAHTRARCEKALARDLLSRQISYFLPMIERVTLSGGRKRRVLMPLFPSYVFVCGDAVDRHAALTTQRISRTIEAPDQAGLVAELAAIERALAGEEKLELYPSVPEGRRCRVKAGPFEGMEGIVVRRAKRARLALQVSILGRGTVMEIDADLLEAVD